MMTPEAIELMVSGGVSLAEAIARIVLTIRTNAGLSAEAAEAQVKRIVDALPAEVAGVKADTAHVDAEDDAGHILPP